MASPKAVELTQNLTNAQARMKSLLDDNSRFNNDCEEVFENFRRAVVHCKNNKENGQKALDSLSDKEIAVSFMCKFCKARPGFGRRCEEVLKILMLSDEWKKMFKKDPEAKDLPPVIAEQLTDGAEEATGTSIVTVVQRCTRAQVLQDESASTWTQVGRGLLVCIDFQADASKLRIREAARALLNAPLSSGADRKSTESVLALCKRGEEQTVLVILQTSLSSKLKTGEAGDVEVECKANVEADSLREMFDSFIAQLKEFAKEAVDSPPAPERTVSNGSTNSSGGARALKIVASDTGSSQSWEVCSDGFMHTFTF